MQSHENCCILKRGWGIRPQRSIKTYYISFNINFIFQQKFETILCVVMTRAKVYK